MNNKVNGNNVSDEEKQRQIDQLNGNSTKQRRTRVPDRPDYNLSLWSILKSFIGKDLTKIPLPVNFNEPLSMLQRSAEIFEYYELLDKAAKCDNIAEQIALVATFIMASHASSSYRVFKPFNPLLGETFECDRMSDFGWKLISEQVSHHPPVLAQYCESKNGWRCWQDLQMSSKFRGKHLTVVPQSFSRIEFTKQGRSYRFTRPTTYIHNIIIGKLYTEHAGETFFFGEGKAEGWQCNLTYHSNSLFSRDQKRVTGEVVNPSGKTMVKLNGHWDDKMDMTMNDVTTVVWRNRLPPEESKAYYHFNVLQSQLNEKEEGVAPTDSRNRPDQRMMEQGAWDEANEEKVRLEEKQRERRRDNRDVEPIWFAPHKDTTSEQVYWRYVGGYWECKSSGNWKKCAEIF